VATGGDRTAAQHQQQKVLEEIEELTNPKSRTGKKALTARAEPTQGQHAAVLDTPCATNRAKMPPCAWCSSPRAAPWQQEN
jgi:hypothetical protein